MNFVKKLKCSIYSKQNLRFYYESLSKEELANRRSSQLNFFITTNLAWIFSFVTILIASKMSPPLIILYAGVIISLLISTWTDYKRRVSLIDEILKSK